MATTITQTSDPILWQELNNRWLSEMKPGWVVITPTHYQVKKDTNGDPIFVEYTSSMALLDSRSLMDSPAASYAKLE